MIDIDVVADDPRRPALRYQPAFETFAGTLDWSCMRCGLRVSENVVRVFMGRLEGAFERDPTGTLKRLLEDQNEATRLIEKINRLGGPP
ncbi:MAG: hypothetical protein OXI26_09685 [bacterium]|nr:hypothetical protein [bacterium]